VTADITEISLTFCVIWCRRSGSPVTGTRRKGRMPMRLGGLGSRVAVATAVVTVVSACGVAGGGGGGGAGPAVTVTAGASAAVASAPGGVSSGVGRKAGPGESATKLVSGSAASTAPSGSHAPSGPSGAASPSAPTTAASGPSPSATTVPTPAPSGAAGSRLVTFVNHVSQTIWVAAAPSDQKARLRCSPTERVSRLPGDLCAIRRYVSNALSPAGVSSRPCAIWLPALSTKVERSSALLWLAGALARSSLVTCAGPGRTYELRYPRMAPRTKMRDDRINPVRLFCGGGSALLAFGPTANDGDWDGASREACSSSRAMK